MDYSKLKNAAPELIRQASEVKSADELFKLLSDNGYSVSASEAEEVFTRIMSLGNEIAEDELTKIAGGIPAPVLSAQDIRTNITAAAKSSSSC